MSASAIACWLAIGISLVAFAYNWRTYRRWREVELRLDVLEQLADYDVVPDQPAPGGETRLDFSVVEDAKRARAARERAR